MQKIGLFLDVSPCMGGAFQYSQSLLKAFIALDSKIYTKSIVYTDKVWEEYLNHIDANKIFIKNCKYTYFWGILITVVSFPIGLWKKIAMLLDPTSRKLKKENCDLWIFSGLTFLSYMFPVNSIGIIHDLMHRYEKFPEISSFITYHWREMAFKRLCKHCKGIFVDSEVGKQQVIESYKVNPVKIYSLPFVPAEYIYSKEVTDDFIKLKLPEKYIFYPAQFWAHKNHINLLKAISMLKNKYPDIKLVLVGSKKNAYEIVKAEVKKLKLEDNVIFLGYVPDQCMPELYRRARAMVFPSFFGPTNIPPLEAMVTCCPMALSDVYAMKEQSGGAALYFDPKDIEDIAKCIERLWEEDKLCFKLKEKSLRIRKRYTQNEFNREFLSNLQSML